jgi:hypothetical protein
MSEQKPLKNPCNYSFEDLIKACGVDVSLNDLYGMLQEDRNTVVKEMCAVAKWHWEDIEKDGIVYTAFAPERQ